MSNQPPLSPLEKLLYVKNLVNEVEANNGIEKALNLGIIYELVKNLENETENPALNLIKKELTQELNNKTELEVGNKEKVTQIALKKEELGFYNFNNFQSVTCTELESVNTLTIDSENSLELQKEWSETLFTRSEARKAALDEEPISPKINSAVTQDVFNFINEINRVVSHKHIFEALKPKWDNLSDTQLTYLIFLALNNLTSSWRYSNWWKPDFKEKAILKYRNQYISSKLFYTNPKLYRDYIIRWTEVGIAHCVIKHLNSLKKLVNPPSIISFEEYFNLTDFGFQSCDFVKEFNKRNTSPYSFISKINRSYFVLTSLITPVELNYDLDNNLYIKVGKRVILEGLKGPLKKEEIKVCVSLTLKELNEEGYYGVFDFNYGNDEIKEMFITYFNDHVIQIEVPQLNSLNFE